jgi:chromosome segregation ATPase
MSDAELEARRDQFKAELDRLNEQLEQNERAAGGDEAHRLAKEVEAIEAEVAKLQARADEIAAHVIEHRDLLEGLRREANGARRHLASLLGERT